MGHERWPLQYMAALNFRYAPFTTEVVWLCNTSLWARSGDRGSGLLTSEPTKTWRAKTSSCCGSFAPVTETRWSPAIARFSL
jgi:hypothetical protein